MDNVFSIPGKERCKTIVIYGFIATIVFTVIYGLCNSLAAQSATRYSLYTQWELEIPLIPWMIYPYLSLNILFVMAAFVLKEVSAIKGYCLGIMGGAVVSVVLVHQHHLFDVVSGYLLSMLIFKFVVLRFHETEYNPHSYLLRKFN